MNGKKMRLELVVVPEEDEAAADLMQKDEAPVSENKGSAKVISFEDLKK
jgi:hypothetical protein